MESVKEKKTRLGEIGDTKQLIEDDIKMLESHFLGLKNSLLNFATLEAFHKARKKEFDLVLEREKDAQIKIAEFRKEIEMTQREILGLQKEIKEKTLAVRQDGKVSFGMDIPKFIEETARRIRERC